MTAPSLAPRSAAAPRVARLLLALPLLLLFLASSERPEDEAVEVEAGEEEAGLLQVAAKAAPAPATSPWDIRAELPACFQYKYDWCWSTTLAEVAGFYNDSFKVYGKWGHQALEYDTFGNKALHYECATLECYITGVKLNEDQPYACCPPSPTRSTCWPQLATADQVVGLLWKLVGVNYFTKELGVLSHADLDKVVAKKKPIILQIYWCGGASHFVTIAGSNGQGKYYLHDPLYVPANFSTFKSELSLGYQELTYDEVVRYTPPDKPSQPGRWKTTALIKDEEFYGFKLQDSPACD